MRRLAPVFATFFLAPLVAEFFLGDFPIVLLPLIIVLAPMYGGAALLIREITRRTGRGWPTILTLALAFGVLQEGLLTQSLFNPDYENAHLLDQGFVPALGTAAPWLVFVLTLHTVWSISTPLAIVEESTRDRRTTPWLGRTGLGVVAGLFVLGSVVTFVISSASSHGFVATPRELGTSAAAVVLLVALAFVLPRPRPVGAAGTVPNGWIVALLTLLAGGLFMAGTALPLGLGLAALLAAPVLAGVFLVRWSRRAAWGRWQRLGAAAGALLTYSWHAFLMHTSTWPVDLISHVLYALGALAVLRLAVRRTRGARPSVAPAPAPLVPALVAG